MSHPNSQAAIAQPAATDATAAISDPAASSNANTIAEPTAVAPVATPAPAVVPRVPSPMRALEQPVNQQSPVQTARALPPDQLAAASRGDRRSLLAFLRSRRIA